VVVQHDDPAGPDDPAQEVEIDEHLVEPVAAVDERRIGGEPFPDESWQGQGRRLEEQPCHRVEPGRSQHPPADVGPLGGL